MTPERFARSLTFDDYVSFTGSPEKLRREGFDIRWFILALPRPDWSGYLRERSATARLTELTALDPSRSYACCYSARCA